MFSRRTYLYDHPRVAPRRSTTTSRGALAALHVRQVVSFHERGTPAVNSRRSWRRGWPDISQIGPGVGRRGGQGPQPLRLSYRPRGGPVARALSAPRSRRRVQHHDGAAGWCRVGPLPSRGGGTDGPLAPGRPAISTGEMVWRRLRERGGRSRSSTRSVLAIPGGLHGRAAATCGRSAASSARLPVVLLPNGGCGAGATSSRVLRRVDRRRRTRVVIAPTTATGTPSTWR
jgi:hypothetical protein